MTDQMADLGGRKIRLRIIGDNKKDTKPPGKVNDNNNIAISVSDVFTFQTADIYSSRNKHCSAV